MTKTADYARPDTLVGTGWVAEHLHEPNIRCVEVDVDTSAYEQGHVPGAVDIRMSRTTMARGLNGEIWSARRSRSRSQLKKTFTTEVYS